MYLYKLIQSSVRGYDTYSNCVVCAPDEETAAKIHPSGDALASELDRPFISPYTGWEDSRWAQRPIDVEVVYLGVADPSIPEGVVCASFHAG